MARSFNSTEAYRLRSDHRDLLRKLEDVQTISNQDRQEIKKTADEIVAQSVMKLLRDVSVEELNRDKNGIRVKALQDSGFHTMADVATASVYRLASVRGIGQDTAYLINRLANDYVARARQSTKIRISADDRSIGYSRLVQAVAIYKDTQSLLSECRMLHSSYSQKIKYALDDITPGLNSGLRWFFTSRAVKKQAEDAYSVLKNSNVSDYAERARLLLYQIQEARAITSSTAWERFSKNPIGFINVLEDIVPELLGTDDAEYGLPKELAQEIQDQCFFPDGLLCDLRRYQEWGVKYILHQEKVLLGDEMGLGKTIQAIATMVSLKNTDATHFLVVCPASVITNWCREITEKSRLRVTSIHGTGRTDAFHDWIDNGGVAVTTYETTGYLHFDEDFRFSQMVVDEAHYIKNPEAMRSINVKNIADHAERLLFMTGTALENKVEEMISLIQILRPNIANQIKGMAFMSAAPQFREKVAPVYYRRKREDVLTELPDKIESKEWCTLLPEEEEVYERSVLSKNYAEARRVSWSVDDMNKSSKAKRLMEIIEEATSDGRKIIVFSFFLDTIRKVTELLGTRCTNPINGSVTPQRRQEIIDEFDKAPVGSVLPAQIQSGGTGLNIQSASVVIICEPQFKPSIENQAISRAYRMGQARNVLVYRLLCENSVDEKITEMLEEKQKLFDAFADKSVAASESLELDDKTFGNIIKEEIDRINAKHKQETK